MTKPNAGEVTASAVITFMGKLEDASSRFYAKLAERYCRTKETFLAFAEESAKNKALVIRTYQETITDAIEACFSFKDLNLDHHLTETTLAEDAGYSDALEVALELEDKASRFYRAAAEQSGSLLATIPRAFRKVSEIRSKRKLKLESLLDILK